MRLERFDTDNPKVSSAHRFVVHTCIYLGPRTVTGIPFNM